jgi:glycosyltransferase involved in cell wall biosynthesis
MVDGGSTDGTASIARQLTHDDPRFRIVEAGEATPGRGRNVGIDIASHGWVALTDAGIRLEPEWLRELVEQAQRHPDASIVYGAFDPLEDSFFEQCAALAYVPAPQRNGEGVTRGRSIASSLLRRDVWKAVGGFPDLRAAEDLMFMERAADAGFREVWAPRARVWWRLQPTLARTWRRFVVYSRCNVLAGRQRFWHYGVARQYLAVAVCIALAVAMSPWWLALPLLAFLTRVGRSIWIRRGTRPWWWCFNPAQFALVALIVVAIDVATFVGWAQAFMTAAEPSLSARPEPPA